MINIRAKRRLLSSIQLLLLAILLVFVINKVLIFENSFNFISKQGQTTNQLINQSTTPDIKIVVWWSADKNKNDEIQERHKEECFRGCNIEVSHADQGKVDEADAVLFLTGGLNRLSLPVRKSSSQIWVLKLLNPPGSFVPGEHLNGVFNWTMTYREDSDVYQPYSKAVLSQDLNKGFPGNKTLEEWILGKTGVGTALISNCGAKSKRLEILESLKQSGLSIDIYGKCGITEGVCGKRDGNCGDFWEELGSKYKFYFAFENNLCTDYISEKFRNPLKWGMVPVVLGRGNYEKFAPPHSFIDIRDFPSPKALVEYLQRLDGNSEEYGKYFEWREQYTVIQNGNNLCDLCSRMKLYKYRESLDEEKKKKIYQHPNLTEWWIRHSSGEGPACIPPEEMGLQNYLKN